MGRYAYRALAPDGSRLRGELEAASDRDAARQLQARGSYPLEIRPAERGWLAEFLRREMRLGRDVRRRDIAILTQELGSLVAAGLPLDRSLHLALEARGRGPLARVLRDVLERVRGGSTLARALAAHGTIFDAAYRSVVEAGERSGHLGQALKRLGEDRKRADSARQKILSSLLYPSLLIVMAGLSLGFITTTVLPQFRPMLAEAGVQLTVSAEVLFSIGDLLTNHWLTLLLGAFVAGTALVVVIRQPASRLWIDGRLLRAPAVGPFLREAAAAQYCRLLAMLHGNGIPLPAAIGIAAEAVGSPTLQAALRHVQTKVKEGRGLAGTLQETGLCPPLVIHLVRVGEETGRLSEMLLRAADLLDERLQHMTERFTALLVPVLTLVIGVVIAVAVTSVFSALLSLNEAIQ